MGTIICGLDMLKNDLADLRSKSSTLDKILGAVLDKGDLTIHVTGDRHSFYDNRNIFLGLQQLPNRIDQISTLIMEICNAGMSMKEDIQPKAFSTAEAYGSAVERHEWKAVKKHVKIFQELATTPANLGKSRFEGAFTDPAHGWENFDNYLAHQRKTGHTKQIESHWKQ